MREQVQLRLYSLGESAMCSYLLDQVITLALTGYFKVKLHSPRWEDGQTTDAKSYF